MARPQKSGLDYFPLDVDIDQDDKVLLIEAQHGVTGFAVVIKLLMKIYKNSYFYEWTEKEQLLFSKRINVDINSINVIINDCVRWGLFDSSLLENYKILTSKGIQKRFLMAMGRRQKIEMEKEYLLLDSEQVNAYKNLVIVDINTNSEEVKDDINPQSKVKKSKVKKSKVEKSKEDINSLSLSLCKEVEKLSNGKWYLAKDIDKLNALIEMHTFEWVKEAVLKSMSKGKFYIGYVDGILKNWQSEGKEDVKSGSAKQNTESADREGIGLEL